MITTPLNAGFRRHPHEGRITMRKTLASSVLVGAAAAGAIALTAPAAFAATWTVSNGGNFTATSSSVSFKDVTTNQTFNCTASTITGNAPNGTGLSGTGIAHLNSGGSFTGCTGPLGSTGTATLGGGTLNAVSYNSTSPGTTSGTITGITATLNIRDLFGTCTAAVSGSVNTVKYVNSGTLTTAPDASPVLTITSATGSGCAGLIKAGDKTTFTASYSVSPIIKITSP
jgi:hypothetical protein